MRLSDLPKENCQANKNWTGKLNRETRSLSPTPMLNSWLQTASGNSDGPKRSPKELEKHKTLVLA